MRVLRQSPLGLDERRPRIHEGDVFHDAATAPSLALSAAVWSLLEDAFPGVDPRLAQLGMSGAEHFERIQRVRRTVVGGDLDGLVLELLSAWGWDLERVYRDRLRFRAVTSGGHRDAAARDAYVTHRDTWYANPPAQMNVWLAVRDVSHDEAFAFYPDYWDAPIANSSAEFDYEAWKRMGSWQAPHPGKAYPGVLEAVRGPRVQIACEEGESLLFSGSHLHGPVGHDSGRTRFSLELRAVHLLDLETPVAARNVDSRAVGSTLADFRRASDGRPMR